MVVLTDQELLARFAAARDEQAFATLVRRHEEFVRAVCGRVLREPHLAEDAAQTVFLAVAVRAEWLSRRHDSLAPWLRTVATNAARQLQRTRRRSRRREESLRFAWSEASGHDSTGSEPWRVLNDELQDLNDESREAIELCFFQGMTQQQAAEQLGISKSTLRRRIDAGLVELRERFQHRGLMLPAFAAVWRMFDNPSGSQFFSELARQFIERIRPMVPASKTYRIAVVAVAAGVALTVGLWPLIPRTEAEEKPVAAGSTSEQAVEAESAQTKKNSKRGLLANRPKASASKAKAETIEPPVIDPVAAEKATPPIPQKPVESAEKIAAPKTIQRAQAQTQTQTNSAFSGVMNINGQEFRTNDPAEFQKMMQQNQNQFPQLPQLQMGGNGAQAFGGAAAGGNAGGMAKGMAGGGAGGKAGGGAMAGGGAGGNAVGNAGGNGMAAGANAGVFNGVMNINGQEFRTNDPAEFQKMMQQNQNLFPQLPQLQMGGNGAQAFGGAGAGGNAGGMANGFAGGAAGGNAAGAAMGNAGQQGQAKKVPPAKKP